MKQFLAFVQKEFFHVFRDSKSLLMLFGLPIVQIVLFGFALSNEIKDAQFVVLDQSKDSYSHQIVEKLAKNAHFRLYENILNEKELDDVFETGKVKLAVIIPSDFERDMMQTGSAKVQLIGDASDPNTASTLINYATSVIMSFQQELQQPNVLPMQIGIETRMLYNPELKGATNFVPGVMALVLMLVCVLMTSVSIVREKELGTMEILLVSPFNPLMVIIAKAFPYFFLSLINLSIILFLSVFLLDMEIAGSLPLLIFESSLLIFTALSLGLLISNSTDSQQAAMLISLMGMLIPTVLFTGFMFPLENMPWPLQLIANMVPSKWYYIIVKSVMLKGLGIEAIWKETLILMGMTLFFLMVSFRKFKIRLS